MQVNQSATENSTTSIYQSGLIPNWKGELLEVAYSKGGTMAVKNPFDNLISTGIFPWPPPEIVQKLRERGHACHFDRATWALGHYCDLQSINSEDALTWSVFGTAAYAPPAARRDYVRSLFNLLEIPTRGLANASIWLWRRVPHPEKPAAEGPEIDFGIQTDEVVVLGEAKWCSPEARNQGPKGDKGQFELRCDFLEQYGPEIFRGVSHFVVLAVSLEGKLLDQAAPFCQGALECRNLTWDEVCGISTHPLAQEVNGYLKWKKERSLDRRGKCGQKDAALT